MTHPLNEYNKEPFQRVENAIEIALIEMLFQLRKKFGEDGVVMCKESGELRKAENKQSVHSELREKVECH